MTAPSPRAEALAAAFVSSDAWTVDALVMHGAAAFGQRRRPRWLRYAARRAIQVFPEPPRSRLRALAFELDAVLGGFFDLPRLRTFPIAAPAMGSMPWSVPELVTTGDLASWLGLSPAETMWFADPRGLERRAEGPEALRHYRYAWIAKPSGSRPDGHRGGRQ